MCIIIDKKKKSEYLVSNGENLFLIICD